MARIVATAVIAAAFWAPIVAAVVANRLDPGLNSGLAVPYAVIAGLAIGVLVTALVVLASRRWPMLKPSYWAVGAIFAVTIALFPLADRGALSVVH